MSDTYESSITNRIERLERQNRLFKSGIVLAVLCVSSLFVMGQAQAVTRDHSCRWSGLTLPAAVPDAFALTGIWSINACISNAVNLEEGYDETVGEILTMGALDCFGLLDAGNAGAAGRDGRRMAYLWW